MDRFGWSLVMLGCQYGLLPWQLQPRDLFREKRIQFRFDLRLWTLLSSVASSMEGNVRKLLNIFMAILLSSILTLSFVNRNTIDITERFIPAVVSPYPTAGPEVMYSAAAANADKCSSEIQGWPPDSDWNMQHYIRGWGGITTEWGFDCLGTGRATCK